ncbi:glycosyl hydrolase family 76-domain-containing protein [Infundibulicybe gibba]|nr:glycosyl hydrolase family 76-domain-containing protein [Infundibulicybe gibba]
MFSRTVSLLSAPLVLLLVAGSVGAKCQKYADAAKSAAASFQSNTSSTAVDPDTAAQVLSTVFKGQENHLDTGKSYDDVQWVSIAYLRAGNIPLAKKYYDIAATGGDTAYCGGGLFWNGKHDFKNAITNELFMATSGYLFDETQEQKYLENLKKTWSWLKSTKMRGKNGLFNDGLTKDGTCSNDGGIQWTYNQGTVLVGLGYLFKHTGDQRYLRDARGIIDAIIKTQTVSGGLREACEDQKVVLCNLDQQTFKGITMYFMAWYLSISGDSQPRYSAFIKAQADKVIANAKTATGDLGVPPTSSSHASALGALVAAAQQDC